MKRLRVALETQFAYGTPTGLGVYAAQLCAALQRRADVEVIELCDPRFHVWDFGRRLYWDQVIAVRLARRVRADLVHFTGGTLPLRAPHPCVLSLHDLAWLRGAVPARFYSHWYFARMQRRLVRQADRLTADSEWARQELVQQLQLSPARIAVTGAGVEERYFGLPRAVVDPPYVLAVGTVEERKDLATALRMLALQPGLRLIAAGPHTGYARTVLRLAQTLGVSDRVELRGYVDTSQLEALYSGAVALVFPSWYEGFGLPPLQALAAQVPVVASDIPVMREVLGECAWFAPPQDAQAFSDALDQVRRGGAEVAIKLQQGRMWVRQFAWATVADKTVRLYRSLV